LRKGKGEGKRGTRPIGDICASRGSDSYVRGVARARGKRRRKEEGRGREKKEEKRVFRRGRQVRRYILPLVAGPETRRKKREAYSEGGEGRRGDPLHHD